MVGAPRNRQAASVMAQPPEQLFEVPPPDEKPIEFGERAVRTVEHLPVHEIDMEDVPFMQVGGEQGGCRRTLEEIDHDVRAL